MKKYFVKCVVAMVVGLSVLTVGAGVVQAIELDYVCVIPLGGGDLDPVEGG